MKLSDRHRIRRKRLDYFGHMWTFDYLKYDGRWVPGGPYHNYVSAWFAARRAVRQSDDTGRMLDALERLLDSSPAR